MYRLQQCKCKGNQISRRKEEIVLEQKALAEGTGVLEAIHVKHQKNGTFGSLIK